MDRIEFGDYHMSGLGIEDIQLLRNEIRTFLLGRTEKVRTGVNAKLPGGVEHDLEFGPEVGWPLVDGGRRDFMQKWLADY